MSAALFPKSVLEKKKVEMEAAGYTPTQDNIWGDKLTPAHNGNLPLFMKITPDQRRSLHSLYNTTPNGTSPPIVDHQFMDARRRSQAPEIAASYGLDSTSRTHIGNRWIHQSTFVCNPGTQFELQVLLFLCACGDNSPRNHHGGSVDCAEWPFTKCLAHAEITTHRGQIVEITTPNCRKHGTMALQGITAASTRNNGIPQKQHYGPSKASTSNSKGAPQSAPPSKNAAFELRMRLLREAFSKFGDFLTRQVTRPTSDEREELEKVYTSVMHVQAQLERVLDLLPPATGRQLPPLAL
ncbi:hypothetical protein C8R43DRAFT_957072 [Mycena crocata]|nr:hypothetical protein C8R43DRAFT_957072 [Mycena crocata]